MNVYISSDNVIMVKINEKLVHSDLSADSVTSVKILMCSSYNLTAVYKKQLR